jgi:hypothetical protein
VRTGFTQKLIFGTGIKTILTMKTSGNSNTTTSILLIDTHTMQIRQFYTKKTCAEAMGVRVNVIDVYLDKNRLYKKQYVLQRGEQHDKKIHLNIQLSKKLYDELQKITDGVAGTNLTKLTSAITKDFVFKYENKM